MTMLVDPSERFGDVRWPRRSERFDSTDPPMTDPHEYAPCVYSCSRCSHVVRFSEADFTRHAATGVTNLSASDAEDATRAVLGLDVKGFSFVDFYCPKCALPVRVYFALETGGKCFDVLLKVVVEGTRTDECERSRT
jgi:hypothetical protein